MPLFIVTETVEYMYEAENAMFALAMEVQDADRDHNQSLVIIDREVRELS